MNTELANLLAGDALNIAALVLLSGLLSQGVMLEPEWERSCRRTIWLMILVITAECACALLDTLGPAMRIPNLLFNAVGFTASGALPYVMAAANGQLTPRIRRLAAASVSALAILCALSPWTGWLFSVSTENVYARGPLFPVYLFVFLGGIFALAAANLREARRFFTRERVLMLLLYLLFLSGITLQLLWPRLHTSWHCVTLSLFLYYIFQREVHIKYDLLTDTLNRASFEKASAQMQPGSLVVLFDLDDFKQINDSFGHQAGDLCLRETSALLRECFASIGRCYRIGGDEFVVLGIGDESQLRRAMTRLMDRIHALRSQHKILPNVSYGSSFLRPGESFDSAFRRADEQMYQYKLHRTDRTPRSEP